MVNINKNNSYIIMIVASVHHVVSKCSKLMHGKRYRDKICQLPKSLEQGRVV